MKKHFDRSASKKGIPLSISMLCSCASCAVQTDANLSCARCRTDYCSPECQVAHWASGVHRKECKGLARARRDTDLEVQSRALARVSQMSGGAPDDAHCLFCLDGGDPRGLRFLSGAHLGFIAVYRAGIGVRIEFNPKSHPSLPEFDPPSI